MPDSYVVISDLQKEIPLSILWDKVNEFLEENYQYYGKDKRVREDVKPFVIASMSTSDELFEVVMTSNSINKMMSNGGHTKFACLFHLKEIVERGILDRVEDPKPEHRANENKIYFFKTKVLIESTYYVFIFSVKEMRDKKTLRRVYSGHLDIKKPLTE